MENQENEKVNPLNSKAVLVRFSTTMFSGKVLDRTATQAVSTQYNLTSDTGHYLKYTVPKESLQGIQAVLSFARFRVHYKYTLPWNNDGLRILSLKLYDEHMKEMKEQESLFFSEVEKFINEYPAHIDQAKIKLGNLFNESDYPAIEQIRKMFTFGLEVEKIPAGEDFRVDLADSEVERISAEINTRAEERVNGAVKVAYQKLYDVVSHMADTLSDPKAKFKNTLTGNLDELLAVLPALNLTHDVNLERLYLEVKNKLAGKDPEDLRHNPITRNTTAKDAQGIMDQMETFMGKVGE